MQTQHMLFGPDNDLGWIALHLIITLKYFCCSHCDFRASLSLLVLKRAISVFASYATGAKVHKIFTVLGVSQRC